MERRLPSPRLALALLPLLYLGACADPGAPADQGPRILAARTLVIAEGLVTGSREDEGLRVYGPGATPAQDLEPEYIAVAPDGSRAWVSLQENNGWASLTLGAVPEVAWVKGLGLQDYGAPGHGADFDDEDGGWVPGLHPGVYGFYQPDGLAAIDQGGQTYVLTANEGDIRDLDLYPGYDEAAAARWFNLSSRSDAETLKNLKVSLHPWSSEPEAPEGSAPGALYTFGGRSWSVRSGTTGALVWDSGDDLDARAAAAGAFDNGRSDNKGSEPEGVTVGKDGGRRWAFVGLERASAVAVYDLADVTHPVFQTLLKRSGDLRPEGLLFVPAAQSPTGRPLLAVGFELSKTLGLWTWDGSAWTDLGSIDLGLSAVDSPLATGAEIVAFDPGTATFWAIANDQRPRLETVALSADGVLTRLAEVDLSAEGGAVNSVAVHGGLVAAAVEALPKTDPGRVVVYRASDRRLLARGTTGAQPDMVTFTPDGLRLLTADEGEANPDYTIDPPGSVTILDLPAHLH